MLTIHLLGHRAGREHQHGHEGQRQHVHKSFHELLRSSSLGSRSGAPGPTIVCVGSFSPFALASSLVFRVRSTSDRPWRRRGTRRSSPGAPKPSGSLLIIAFLRVDTWFRILAGLDQPILTSFAGRAVIASQSPIKRLSTSRESTPRGSSHSSTGSLGSPIVRLIT